jgi:TusA-related sulfurtransferase
MPDGTSEATRDIAAKAARQLDVRGLICPYPLMEARDALKQLETGQVLEVVSDFEAAAKGTIPFFCRKKGYPIETVEEGPSLWRLYIQKID